MTIHILNKIKSHYKQIDFSKITLFDQFCKVVEETNELRSEILYIKGVRVEAERKYAKERIISEYWDLVQTIVQMGVVLIRDGWDLSKSLEKHNAKLIEKRDAEFENSIKIKIASEQSNLIDIMLQNEALRLVRDCINPATQEIDKDKLKHNKEFLKEFKKELEEENIEATNVTGRSAKGH